MHSNLTPVQTQAREIGGDWEGISSAAGGQGKGVEGYEPNQSSVLTVLIRSLSCEEPLHPLILLPVCSELPHKPPLPRPFPSKLSIPLFLD